MAKKAGPKAPTKSVIMNNIAEKTGASKKEVVAFFDALTSEIEENIAKRGSPGQFTIPGLCKIVIQDKPALPKREVRNPGTGEMVWAKPRPARKVVKVRALKGLKDMVSEFELTRVPTACSRIGRLAKDKKKHTSNH